MVLRSSVRRGAAGVALLTALTAAVAGCTSSEQEPPKPSPSPSATSTTDTLTLAVYGPRPVLRAYDAIAAAYTEAHPKTQVEVQGYATHAAAMAALRQAQAAGDPPDLFLVDRGDLGALEQDKAVRRVDDLLAERQVDFGDGYSRSGLEAFSSDAALQCMPTAVSPMVVYYNPRLVELDQIREVGRTPVTQEGGWSLDDFATAALQPRAPGVRGLYVAPDLEQIAPFVLSGGGQVVDDTDQPTTLKLSDDSSAAALEKLLVLLRDPGRTFDQSALRRSSALQRFKAGKLGMMLGYRDLTPVLRAQPSLTFDVMPLPVVGSTETIGQMSGLCLSADSKQTGAAADLLTAMISDKSASLLAATGYVMPANLDVVNDDVFLQTGQRPLHSDVFAREMRDVNLLPDVPRWPLVGRVAARQLTQLFYQPVIEPLQDRLAAIDAASVPVFDPTKTASPTPTPSPTPSSPTSTP